MLIQYVSKFGEFSNCHRLGKDQFHSNAKEYSNYHTIVPISHTSSIMLRILQVRLQQCVNWELPDVQDGFRKGRETRDQIANLHWITEKARELQKSTDYFSIDYTKAFGSVGHNKLWEIFKEVGNQQTLSDS